MAEYQTANRDLTAQAEESQQQLQVIASTHHMGLCYMLWHVPYASHCNLAHSTSLSTRSSVENSCKCQRQLSHPPFPTTIPPGPHPRNVTCTEHPSKSGATLQACVGECNALRDECRAISEDLEVLVKENQVVNHQLTTATTERYAC